MAELIAAWVVDLSAVANGLQGLAKLPLELGRSSVLLRPTLVVVSAIDMQVVE